MKKNELASFLVYILMFAIAFLIGWYVIRPVLMDYSIPNYIAVVIISLIIGIFFNGGVLELGHVLGAKGGKCEVYSVCLFGFTWYKAGEKWKFKYAGYEGLTGETKIKPMDVEKSSINGYLGLPVLFIFVEIIVCIVLAIISRNDMANLAWLTVAAYIVIAVGGMVFLYDFFPARIDSINDGYLFALLSRPANKIAINHWLLADYAKDNGEEIPPMPIFDDVTDFIADINLLSAYQLAQEGKIEECIKVLDKTIDAENAVNALNKANARAIKLGLLLRYAPEKGKKMYEEYPDNDKRFIANLGCMSALRAYLLISSVVEGSDTEANFAIDKVEKVLKNEEKSTVAFEKKLLIADVDFVKKSHPTWEIYPLPWEEKTDEE